MVKCLIKYIRSSFVLYMCVFAERSGLFLWLSLYEGKKRQILCAAQLSAWLNHFVSRLLYLSRLNMRLHSVLTWGNVLVPNLLKCNNMLIKHQPAPETRPDQTRQVPKYDESCHTQNLLISFSFPLLIKIIYTFFFFGEQRDKLSKSACPQIEPASHSSSSLQK